MSMTVITKNTFSKGPEGWCSYDYHQSMAQRDRRGIFVLLTTEKHGGVNDGPYAWTTHHLWTPDVPEDPISILPLLHYRGWMNEDKVDLRDAEVSFSLRGDNLNLRGAECYFWVVSGMGRWHLNSSPIDIPEGEWQSNPTTLKLTTDENLWHNSWYKDKYIPLTDCLRNCASYGFSFVGFSEALLGKLSIGHFEINKK